MVSAEPGAHQIESTVFEGQRLGTALARFDLRKSPRPCGLRYDLPHARRGVQCNDALETRRQRKTQVARAATHIQRGVSRSEATGVRQIRPLSVHGTAQIGMGPRVELILDGLVVGAHERERIPSLSGYK